MLRLCGIIPFSEETQPIYGNNITQQYYFKSPYELKAKTFANN